MTYDSDKRCSRAAIHRQVKTSLKRKRLPGVGGNHQVSLVVTRDGKAILPGIDPFRLSFKPLTKRNDRRFLWARVPVPELLLAEKSFAGQIVSSDGQYFILFHAVDRCIFPICELKPGLGFDFQNLAKRKTLLASELLNAASSWSTRF